jgi:3-dehydroquinate synthase
MRERSKIIFHRGMQRSSEWLEPLKKIADQYALITDQTVYALFGPAMKKKLEECFKVFVISIAPGEESKTREQKATIEDQLFKFGLGRDGAIIAMGGGVICDLVGFVAATYCRGVPFLSIPTTLLAQVDACIGGKVGVNTEQGKNLIGAFYPAQLTLIDVDFLSTLPRSELLNGRAEILKYGVIDSPALLQMEVNESLIKSCCEIKLRIVEEDPHERGVRRILNFGHTIGHACEAASGYFFSHGAAVALGMVGEAYLSHQLGFLKKEELGIIKEIIRDAGFSLALPAPADQIMKFMQRDKKAQKQQPHFVLLERIGKAHAFEGSYCTPISSHLIKEALLWLDSQ